MGLRGAGAKPKTATRAALKRQKNLVHPWEAPDLSRAEKVIAFIESLPCTAGTLAGSQLTLRPWQKKFVREVYKVDAEGNRAVRTAVLSVGRKNGKTQLAAALAL